MSCGNGKSFVGLLFVSRLCEKFYKIQITIIILIIIIKFHLFRAIVTATMDLVIHLINSAISSGGMKVSVTNRTVSYKYGMMQ